MKNIKLLIEYDGTFYSGWQSQENAISIQEMIEKGLFEITRESVKLIGSGRTDAKVHALGQVANFETSCSLEGDKYAWALKSILPRDITVLASEEVAPDFHARFDAKGKKYIYKIYNARLPRALLRNYYFHFPWKLDRMRLQEAGRELLGTHDFTSFMARYCDAPVTEKTIYSIDVFQEGDLVEIHVCGDAFLRHQVRIMVGTMVYVAIGKLPRHSIPSILEAKDRRRAGPTFGPEGLYLAEVYY